MVEKIREGKKKKSHKNSEQYRKDNSSLNKWIIYKFILLRTKYC